MEFQIRNWQHFTWLGGDHIAEQAVHSLDKMLWAMNGELPVRATAVGGRAGARGRGDRQRLRPLQRDVRVRRRRSGLPHVPPDRGLLERQQRSDHRRQGQLRDHELRRQARDHGAERVEVEAEGRRERHVPAGARRAVRGDPRRASRRTTASGWRTARCAAIMGRMAAYTGQTITWEQALASKETLLPAKLDPAAPPPPVVAIPGRTKFA